VATPVLLNWPTARGDNAPMAQLSLVLDGVQLAKVEEAAETKPAKAALKTAKAAAKPTAKAKTAAKAKAEPAEVTA